MLIFTAVCKQLYCVVYNAQFACFIPTTNIPVLKLIAIIFLLLSGTSACAQKNIDNTLDNLQQLPKKYLTGINKKVSQYTSRITTKTEKTLTKLSRWENRIKGLLQKASPETAERLFGNNQLTFTSLLQQLKQGENILLQYQAPYNKYTDDVTTSLKYLAQQKEYLDSGIIKKVSNTKLKMEQLATEEDKAAAMQQFIKERKRELIEQAFKQLGKSRYLTKINKEAYYYTATLKNYKELFNDSKKAEETAKNILNKIPAFTKFTQQNSMLASLFGSGGGQFPPSGGGGGSLAGLQTRASVQSLIQDRIASGGPNAQQAFSDNIAAAKNEISKLKDKLLNSVPGAGNGEGPIPDFKPRMEKTKTFAQRIEYGFNLQFDKTNNLLPAATNLGLSIGYKINSKSIAGIGFNCRLGMGSIQHIKFTHEGIGLRTFIDWKLPPLLGKVGSGFFISGGYELNYNAHFENVASLKNYDSWQRSALLGLTKKFNVKTKWFKATNIQLLYDFLSEQHLPKSQPVVFRVGYNF
jgi:hypothetical protein